MEAQVIFYCHSCDYDNRVMRGTPGHESKDCTFESLTDAWRHLEEHQGHNMEAKALLEDR